MAAPATAPKQRPRIVLMGPQKSGKTSIERVVFGKMSPHETLFLQSTGTLELRMVANNDLVQFQIWDMPGGYELSDGLSYGGQPITPQMIFGECTALVYVLDAQSDPGQECARLAEVVSEAHRINPKIVFEVLIHKVDGDLFLTDEQKIDCQREVQRAALHELAVTPGATDALGVSFYLTSIYDHSIFEALSKIVHKLIPQLPTLENLLNILIANCQMEKAFLFDVISKVYFATDSSPVDMSSYELCSDMIDVVVDVSCIYGIGGGGDGGSGAEGTEGGSASTSDITGGVAGAGGGAATGDAVGGGDEWALANEGGAEATAYDASSASIIRLSNGMVLYLRQVNVFMALVCLMRADNLERQGLIDYNIGCFKTALSKVFEPTAGGST